MQFHKHIQPKNDEISKYNISMIVKFHTQFWHDSSISRSCVFERFPNVFGDTRGSFCEVLKHIDWPTKEDGWVSDLSWVKQVNRSRSKAGVARGMHAQHGKSCQGKLVQAVYGKVLDIIVDARPDSETFGTVDIFELDSQKQNQLWVPRGFLHGFVVPADNSEAVFEYFCDNVYDKNAEVSIAPSNVIENAFSLKAQQSLQSSIDISSLELSDKDCNGLDYTMWMADKKQEWTEFGKLWYK